MHWALQNEVESELDHPAIHVTVESLAAHFESDVGRARAPLRNPHHEARVDEAAKRRATPAAVLIPILQGQSGLSVLLTRRHLDISFGGHVCFPGGRCDAEDASVEATALREAFEEIALPPHSVRLLGRLGDYVTHSGFRISPIVGVIDRPSEVLPRLVPREGEVEEILQIPLHYLLRSESYRLTRHDPAISRAHYFVEHQETVVAGPTVSIMIGLYEELLETHA